MVIMEIFGIGPLEFLLIIIIMLLVLGPEEMLKTARKVGTFIRQLVRSPMWGDVMDTSREIRNLPTRIIQETGLEEDISEIKKVAQAPKQMMNEAAKQLTVEIEPIEVPKIDIKSAVASAGKPVTQPLKPPDTADEVVDVTPVESDPVETEPGQPLVGSIEPGTIDAAPLQVDFDYSPSQVEPVGRQDEVENSPKPLIVEFDQLQISRAVEEPEVDESQSIVTPLTKSTPLAEEQPGDITAPQPKRRTRKPKVTPEDNSSKPEASDPSLSHKPLSKESVQLDAGPISTEIKPETRKKRKTAKTGPVDKPDELIAETLTPHENGRSKNEG